MEVKRKIEMRLMEWKNREANRMPLIVNGALSRDVLAYCNLDAAWLDKVLRRERLGPQDILLMLCDETKQYTIIRRA